MKTVNPEDFDCHVEWICPYAKCQNHNTEYGVEPDWLEQVTCRKCNRTLKVKSVFE